MTESTQPRSIGKYEILGVIGKGGMGVVYKARDPIIDRLVAIKTIRRSDFSEDQQLLARLRMEAKSAGRLHHPNIVTIFDFGEQDELAFLVMEYVEGTNLARVIASGAAIPINTKMEIVIQLCDGLAYAHDLGVIHRDIKPSNICLTERGDPKLLDFGLARFDQTRLTRTGLTSGTLSYMSPERLAGESGPSDDIFALGAVAYEIFTGKCAFPGDSMGEIVNNIRSGAYPVPPSQVADVPSDLDEVIARATASQKARRYASAKEFARALRDVQHSATFQRRIVASASSEDVFRTISLQSPLDNPYTAPDIVAARSQTATHERIPIVDADPDLKTDVMRAQRPPASPPRPAPPPPPADSIHYARTEMLSSPMGTVPPAQPERTAAVAGKKRSAIHSIMDMTRTVVAKARPRRRTRETLLPGQIPATVLTMMGAAKQPAPVVRHNPAIFAASAAALIVAMAAMGVAWSAGPFPFLATYAAAVGAWFFLIRFGERASLRSVVLLALGIHAAAIWQEPLDPALLARELQIGQAIASGTADAAQTAGTPPLAAVILAGWAATGGSIVVRRIVLVIAAIAAAWMMWDAKKPRRALGVATLPLIALEGTLNARLEIVAAAFLVAALTFVTRKRDGVGGFAVIFAAGVATSAVVAIPVIYDASWQVFIFLGAALVGIVVPKIILPSTTKWSSALAALVASSPLLAFLAGRVEILLRDWGTGSVLNGFLTAIAKRIGTTHDPISDLALASAVVVVVLVASVFIIALRAESNESGMADALGLTLLALVTLDPAAWLLVVPFAIAGNRRFWLLVAICSPLTFFAHIDGDVNWIVYAVSLAAPAAWYVAMRLQDAAEVGGVAEAA